MTEASASVCLMLVTAVATVYSNSLQPCITELIMYNKNIFIDIFYVASRSMLQKQRLKYESSHVNHPVGFNVSLG